jgi:single-stranded-DNA-specific exonuclease
MHWLNWCGTPRTGQNKWNDMEKRWTVAETDPSVVDRLSTDLGIHPALCQVLAQRGVRDFESARTFFKPQLSDLHDPFLLKDMDKATTRIIKAMQDKEKMLVYGDYDVDGTTSVASMYEFLCSIYISTKLDYYVPHRYKEGYGISRQGLEYARDHGFTLVVALDCGIKSAELIGLAASWGIDFIVCDHHLPGPELPPAVAILNPKQSGCAYPYKELCGCGVGFKLICALARILDIPDEDTHAYLDLVATAIAADIVPMTGENRVLAFFGLQRINLHPSTGMRALIDVSGYQKALTITNVVFMIAPRVNAAGRMDDARKAIQLFIEKDYHKARELAIQLQDNNTDRRETDALITEEALDLIRSNQQLAEGKSTVVFQPHWHKGVIGIVASRLIEHYYRPTIVLTESGGILSGSARSIPGFNLHEGLDQCSDLLLGFGGHYFAAGMTLESAQLEAFRDRFERIVRESVPENLFAPEIRIDAALRFPDINHKFYRIITRMEPFGPDNPVPVFISRGVLDTGKSSVAKEKHLRFSLKQDGVIMTGIGFNMGEKIGLVRSGQPLDIVYTLDENEWNGVKTIQLKMIDVRSSY